MRLGRIVGEVIATRKNPQMNGFKLLLVRMAEEDGSYAGEDYTVAIDAAGSGPGEMVLTVAGSSAREDPMTARAATDTTIIAIVDAMTAVDGTTRYDKEADPCI